MSTCWPLNEDYSEAISSKFVELWPWMAGAAILTFGISLGPTLRERFSQFTPGVLTNDDPSVGTAIELPDQDVFERPLDSSAETLLVLAGSCSGCSLSAVYPARLQFAPYEQVLIIYLASANQIKKEFKSQTEKVFVVADPNRLWVNTLHAYSAPRFYIVKDQKITAIWKKTEEWPYLWTGESPK